VGNDKAAQRYTLLDKRLSSASGILSRA